MALSRTAKIGLFVVGIPLVLLLVAGIALKVYFSGDRLRAMIVPKLAEATHRDVALRDASLSLFPTFAVAIESLTIANPENAGFRSDAFLVLPEGRVQLSLLPLLSGRVEIGEITLDHPRITLEVTEAGKKNFAFGDPNAPEPPRGGGSSTPGELLVGSFRIIGGVLESVNRRFDTRMLIDGLDQTASMESHRGEGTLAIRGTTTIARFSYGSVSAWYLADQPVTAAEELTYALANDVLTFDRTELRLRDLPLNVTGSIGDLSRKVFQMNLTVAGTDLTMQQLLSLIPPEKLKATQGLTSEGAVAFRMTITGPSGEKVNPATHAEFSVRDGAVRYTGLPKSITGIALAGTFDQPSAPVDDKDIGSLRIDPFQASLGSQSLSGKLSVDNFNNPLIAMTVKGLLDLDEVREFYPLEKGTELHGTMKADLSVNGRPASASTLKASGALTFQGVSVKTAASAKPVQDLRGTITFNNQVVESKQLAVRVGESDMSLAFALRNYLGLVMKDSTKSGGAPSATMTLTSKQLRMADLAASEPPAATGAPAAKKPPAAAGFALPPGLKVDANVAIDKLVTEKFTFTNARGNAAVKDGVVRLNDFTVNAFDGTVRSKGTLDLRDPKRSPFDLDLDVKNVESSAMLPSFTSFGKYLFGKFSTTTSMKGDLNDTLGLDPQTLLGRGTVNISDGKLIGLPMLEKLAGLINVSELRAVNFKDWSNAFSIENGRLTVKGLKVGAGQLALALEGSQGLDGSLDYALSVKLPEALSQKLTLPGVGGELLQFLKDKDGRYDLGFNVGGTMGSPAVSVNAKAQEDAAKRAVDAQKQKLLDDAKKKAGDDLKKKLGDGLKNLLKKP